MPFGTHMRDLDLSTPGDITYSATEDSAERGYSDLNRGWHDPVTYEHLGRGEELGTESIGDIADEGRGHRG